MSATILNSHYNWQHQETLAKIGHAILTPDQCIDTIVRDANAVPSSLVRWHDPTQTDVQQSQVHYHRSEDLLAASVDGVTVPLNAPVPLQRVAIAKPWGQELWYTGIEARGHSRVGSSPTKSLPLAQY